MDPLSQQQNQPLSPSPRSFSPFEQLSRIPRIWLIAAILLIILGVGGVLLFLPKQTKKVTTDSQPIQPTQTAVTISANPSPTISADLQKAINEAKSAASEYDSWQQTEITQYPWLRKLPLAASNYYIYFDINKKTFYGRLYPKSGEDVEQIKKLLLQDFTIKQIPTNTYPIVWSVNP